jgi:hypothetical protein
MRTDAEILNHDPITVILGGREYPLYPIKKGKSRKFCARAEQLMTELEQYTSFLRELDGLTPASLMQIDVTALFALVKRLIGSLGHDVIDLVYEYDDALARDREYIEENATMDEFVVAFTVCLRMAFGPFWSLPGRVKRMMTTGQTQSSDTIATIGTVDQS